jgi:Vitamin K-dependent gamma-carboxylase
MTIAAKNSTAGRRARAKVTEIFGADLRSLATFRIALALLVLGDLASRATDLFQHYTDAGVLPRTVLLGGVLSPWAFSLNLMNGETFFQALLFGVAALAALGMLLGYRTTLMTIVVWVLLLSIDWRNPLINGSEGTLLRVLLFWGMLLPLGAYWSVDRARSELSRPSPRFLSLATFGLFMQIAFVYWFTAALKSGPEWRVDGTALYYALSLDQIATPVGHFLLNFPALLHVLTFGTFALEAFGPLLLFCPIFTGPVRTGAALAFMSLHFGIWLTMDIGIFPWISAFCMVCFFPTWFWEKASALHTALSRRIALLRRLQAATARLGHAIGGFSLALLSSLEGARRLLFAGSGLHRDPLADHTAVLPLAAGTTDGAETSTPHDEVPVEEPEPAELRSSLAVNLLAFFFVFYILCWNLTTVTSFTLPERAVPLGPFLGLDQYWGMFAPSPSKEDGWYVIPGELRDGQKVDLMPITRDDYGMHPISYEKPQDIPATYKNEHWRKYLENIYNQDHADQRLYFGQYICRQWNAQHKGSDTLETFRIVYMLEKTLPDYRQSKPEKVDLWNHTC